jgi:putative transposase
METPTLTKESLNKVKAVSDLSENDWQTAIGRYHIIAPIINNLPGVSVAGIARQAGLHRATIFRWIQRYKSTASVSVLANDENTRNTGKLKLSEKVETIVNAIIQQRYLTKQKLTIKKISIEITAKCKAAGLEAPHYLTIRNRINKISAEQKLACRHHSSMARNKYKPLEGSFPGADYPLAAVQVDHTPLDILVVDEVYREPVGKPWITMAIDVYSRMIVGFYISLDPPGALGTGLCLSHAILPKALWLTELDVAGKWPCYGLMKSLYMDNAREFHGKMLERACQEYGIEINFRPVATPNYGGHIERLLGTVLKEIHTLPGTTFSNTKDRKYYDAEGKACFTLKELEKWLATFIVNVYHQRIHSAINTTPCARYNEGILGNDNQIGTGLSKPIENELKLKLDFMPFVERTVQRYGISIDLIWYYHDILRKWIHAHEKPNARYKTLRKFAFKRDPRDISAVYFFDPEIKDYFCIPYRNTSHPSITIWEHKRILRDLKEKGLEEVNEDIIFDAYDKLRHIEETATGSTAAAKRLRNKARKRYATKSSIKNKFAEGQGEDPAIPVAIDFTKKYLPFEDLEG